jgi:hypothetical protein
MLGSDPIAALLGAGTDPRSPQVVWKRYLRSLVEAGAAVTMLGPDVTVPSGADATLLAVLHKLIQRYPPGVPMPTETTGKLASSGQVDTDPALVNVRVSAYFRHITKVVGKELAPDLLQSGIITVSAGLHVACSRMVAVLVPDACAFDQWRSWATQTSRDVYERHSAPTLLLPGCPGGGVYLFRVASGTPMPPRTLQVGQATVKSGDMVVPIPPTQLGGVPVARLGPCRMLPDWLAKVLEHEGVPGEMLAVAV